MTKTIKDTRTKTERITLLAIDTSCDDTSVAVTQNFCVLSNVVSSQDDLHKQWGGVVPDLARRAHAERIAKVMNEALKRAHKTMPDIDAVAVTYGPGLAIALEIGIKKAKELCTEFNKPLIAVNHREGHLLSALAANSKGKAALSPDEIKYPVLGLIISGNTTELVLIKESGVYEFIGETLDDAVGEAYDKTARMLGLGYPGGRVLSEFAKKGDPDAYKFPVPMAKDERIAFSYSGLKTSVYYFTKKLIVSKELTRKQIFDIAASFEKAAISHLQQKLELAIKQYKPGMVFCGGGVVSSAKVRAGLRESCRKYGINLFFPLPRKMFVDNAAMIGVAGYFKYRRGEFAGPDLDREPRAEL